MAAELTQGKKIKRLIKVYGVEGLIEIALTHEGLSMRVPGTKKSLFATWPEVVVGLYTPDDVPSFLAGEPMKFLLHEVEKVQKKKLKKRQGAA